MKAITREWLDRAKDDLLAASLLLTQPELTNVVAFHAQQAVEQPEASGLEHLDLLLLRDKLAQASLHFTPGQKAELAAADQRLLSQAAAFHTALGQITDLAAERQQRQPPPEYWWWYLDVLVQPPLRQRIAATAPLPV